MSCTAAHVKNGIAQCILFFIMFPPPSHIEDNIFLTVFIGVLIAYCIPLGSFGLFVDLNKSTLILIPTLFANVFLFLFDEK